MEWKQSTTMPSKSYECGYCGNSLASNKGYSTQGQTPAASIYICHHCGQPTYFNIGGKQYPGPAFGRAVSHLPSEEVKVLYREARDCMKVDACTAAVMCCRKLLMNIAVAEGAKEGQTFVEYINYLQAQGFMTGKTRDWVEHIRRKGNEANHEIKVMQRKDAEQLITFVETFLRTNYEFPEMLEKPQE